MFKMASPRCPGFEPYNGKGKYKKNLLLLNHLPQVLEILYVALPSCHVFITSLFKSQKLEVLA